MPATGLNRPIAQEVEDVFPDWVETSGHDYKMLTFRGFEALTVEALRELREENDRRLAKKDVQIADLAARLEPIERAMGSSRK